MQSRVRILLALAVLVAGRSAVVRAAESGEALYKAHCQSCHGVSGMADTGPGRVTRTRPISDPDVHHLSEHQMFVYTLDGKDKMRPFRGKLTEEEIRASVVYFRTFLK